MSLVALGLAAVPAVAIPALVKLASARERAHMKEFADNLEVEGLHVDLASGPFKWRGSGIVRGLRVEVSHTSVSRKRSSKTVTRSYTVVRVAEPAERGEIVLHRAHQAVALTTTELVPAHSPLEKYACSAQRADDVDANLPLGSLGDLESLGDVEEVHVGPGGVSLLLPPMISSASWILAAVEAASAIHERRAPRALGPPVHTAGFAGWYWGAAIGAPFLAIILGFVLPTISSTVAGFTSPLACKDGGRVEMVWEERGRKAVGNLFCIYPEGMGPPEKVFLPFLLAFDVMFVSLAGLMLIAGVRAERRERTREQKARTRGTPYR